MGICLRYTKNETDAEDLLQDTFIKVFKTLKQYKGDGDLGAWIRRIAVNTAIERWRKKEKERSVIDTSKADLSDYGHHSISFDHLELGELLEKIQSLPIGYRTIFNLYAIEGYKHHEIAEKLNISTGTSKSQFSRARKILMNMINEETLALNKKLSNG